MKLKDIQDEWDKDSEIDEIQVDESARQVHKKHAKYMRIMSDEGMNLITVEEKLTKLSATLEGYFRGQIDGRDINRPSFKLKIDTKEQVAKLIAADAEYQTLNYAGNNNKY